MASEPELVQKRLNDLAMRAEHSAIFTFTPFLGIAEQDVYYRTVRSAHPVHAHPFGGTDGCERIMLRFGDPEELGYEEPFPIVCLKASPKAPKFAEELTHRDFLGALMHLGIDRDFLGDIVLRDGGAYLFAHERIAPYILESLTRVRHTDLTVTQTDELPSGTLYRTEPRLVQAAGERLDGVIAKLYRISRSDAQALFHRGLVFVGGRLCDSTSHTPRVGEIVSVRGHGRFIYRGFQSETRKGKLNLLVDLYI